MKKILAVYSRFLLLFLLTLSFYFLFMINLPLFREPHGLIVMNDLPVLSKETWVEGLVFGSAAACVLAGVLMMEWCPFFTQGMMANLWACTFLLMWGDSLFSISRQFLSYGFLFSLGLGLGFIYLFFFILEYWGGAGSSTHPRMDWKAKVIYQWLWAWMGFYFGLSGILAVGSWDYQGVRSYLALGALILCFLHYLLCLFFKKVEGAKVDRFSKIGRWIFGFCFLALTLLWALEQVGL